MYLEGNDREYIKVTSQIYRLERLGKQNFLSVWIPCNSTGNWIWYHTTAGLRKQASTLRTRAADFPQFPYVSTRQNGVTCLKIILMNSTVTASELTNKT